MTKSLKDIVQNSNDLFFVKVDKPSKNTKTWVYTVVDPRWCGGELDNHKFRRVCLKRDTSFFRAYKYSDLNYYFVDINIKNAMYRTSTSKYVSNLVEYSVKTNDISANKDDPSVRVTSREMKSKGIDNFVDLCYYYRNYSAIGTGYTRNIRNLVVMDIDVDCTRQDNKLELDKLLVLFAEHDILPNFYIYNKKSKHVQLQWLIKDLIYKDIDNDAVSSFIGEINSKEKNCELNYKNLDFTKISELGIEYRRYTQALCDIVDKKKFGDKNFTFWKAKNPMSALVNKYDLELYMPYYNETVQYLTQEQMETLFKSKESRLQYYNNAPDISEWHIKLANILDPLLEKITEKKVMKYDDGVDVAEIKREKREKKKVKQLGGSRHMFVLNCARSTTIDIAKKFGLRNKEDISKLSSSDFNKLKNSVYDSVEQQFYEEDKKYSGFWPDTSNMSTFTKSEFKQAFESGFSYAIQKINIKGYDDNSREMSIRVRHNKKEIRLIIVDNIRNKYKKIKRKQLLDEVNFELNKLKIKPISEGSLKRFIIESNDLTDERRSELKKLLEKNP